MNSNTMVQKTNPGGLIHQWGRVIIRYAVVWIIPAVLITILAVAYAIFRAPTWEVAQAIMVRNEAIGTEDGIGRFSHADQMKTVEETILEVAYSREVLEQALKEVGPPAKYKGDLKAWPNATDIDDFRGAIGLDAPAGAEFGTTEILYLTVKSETPQRGIKLVDAMFEQLENQLRKIRNAKARSVVAELVRAAELARENLNESTKKLASIEKTVGPDLNELRMMNHLGGNESTIERTIVAIRNELRSAKITLQENETLITLLEDGQGDTDRLLATPNRLLESQPALRSLKNGLITAQLKTAELQGRMLDTHPKVEAALEAERATKQSLHREVKIAILGLKNNMIHENNRIRLLESQRDENIARLQKLAELRTSYANLVEENESRSALLQKADEQLARIRAHQETTLAINLIEPIGTPDPGARPIGPSKSMIAIAGMFGGLLVGFGLLLLVVPVGTLVATAHDTSSSLPTASEVVLGRQQNRRKQERSEQDRRKIKPAKVERAVASRPAGNAESLVTASVLADDLAREITDQPQNKLADEPAVEVEAAATEVVEDDPEPEPVAEVLSEVEEPELEAAVEEEAEVVVDEEPEATVETEPEVEAEIEAEAEAEVEVEAEEEAEEEPEPVAAAEPETRAEAETEVETEVEAEPVEAEVVRDEEPEPVMEVEPEVVEEVEAVEDEVEVATAEEREFVRRNGSETVAETEAEDEIVAGLTKVLESEYEERLESGSEENLEPETLVEARLREVAQLARVRTHRGFPD